MTDPWWILVIVIFMLISFGFDISGYIRGDFNNVMANYDGDKMFCGVSQAQPKEYKKH